MSLADRLANPPPKPITCSVGKTLTKLSKEDLATLTEALSTEGMTSEEISLALRSEGYQVSGYSLRRHRRGECRCVSE